MARVGIIGTGWGARAQGPAFKKAGLEIVAIAGRNEEKTSKAASELGARAYTRWQEVVDHPEIDLISIVTPPSEHREMALRALAAGKHVLCEKPTALDSREAEEMWHAASDRPAQIALIDHELRFLPSWKEAKQRIPDLGDIRYAEVRYASPSRAHLDRPWNWWSDERRQGGGVWGAVGSHFSDALRYLVGEVEEVQAIFRTYIGKRKTPSGEEREVNSDHVAFVHAQLAGGALASMSFSVVAAVDEPTTLTVHGANGALRLVGRRLLHSGIAGEWKEIVKDEGEDVSGDSPGGPFGSASIWLGRALKQALDHGEREALTPGASFLDGLRQQRILDAARRSHRNRGCWEKVV